MSATAPLNDVSSTATRTIADLPGPRRLPLLGNAHQLFPPSRVHLKAEAWADQYGPIVRVNLGLRPLVGISDQKAINELLRDRPNGFRRWLEQRAVIEEMGPAGLFIVEGDDWKRQRRLVVTALNTNHIHRYFEIIRLSTERLHRRLLEAARQARTLDICDELTSYTVDITSALALGHDLNTLERGDSELQGHIRRVMQMTGRRLAMPFPYWRHFRLPADRALDRSIKQMRSAIDGFIEQARERMAARPESFEKPENLLEGMLAAQMTDDGAFTDDEIAGNIFVILLAGEDTTAHTLAWTLWLLGSRPEYQRRLAAEASELLAGDALPGDFETAESMRYAEAVVQESMRLKAVTGMLAVEPINDTTICDTHIPAGTRLLLLLRYASRETAGRTEEFLPERWLAEDEETQPLKTLAFGAGPRFCPGRNLAILESKTALAMIARNFEWEVDETAGPVTEAFEFAIVPRKLRIRIRERPNLAPKGRS
jgi:cytochrome P450